MLIQSCCYLHLQLIDNSYVEFVVLGYVFILGYFYVNFEQFCLVLCFVMDCQRRSLLGSKN